MLLPININSPDYVVEGQKIPAVNASASIDSNKVVHITLVNLHASKTIKISTAFSGVSFKSITGKIVTSAKFNDYDTFENPNKIVEAAFNGAKKEGEGLSVNLPPLSVVMLELK